MRNLYKNKNWLLNEYVNEGKSMREVAKLCNKCHATIGIQLTKFNIPRRPLGRKSTIDKQRLYQQYIIEKLSPNQIAGIFQVHKRTICRALKVHQIPTRTAKESQALWYETHPHPMKEKRGEKHYNWKGGRFLNKAGYVYIYSPQHPSLAKNKRHMCEHRLVMEKHIGRYLHRWEIIHHINGIKDDNRIENLELLPSGRHNKKVQEVYQENQFLKKIVSDFLSIRVVGESLDMPESSGVDKI